MNNRILIGFIAAVVGMQMLGCGEKTPTQPTNTSESERRLPKLVDLGSKKCIPCKKMAPILEKLTREYAGKFDLEFIDVRLEENAQAAEDYKIKLIPTQVFLSPEGKELWRHEGFMDEAGILDKWKELGYDFSASATTRPQE